MGLCMACGLQSVDSRGAPFLRWIKRSPHLLARRQFLHAPTRGYPRASRFALATAVRCTGANPLSTTPHIAFCHSDA